MKIKNKIALYSLYGLLSTSIMGCSNTSTFNNDISNVSLESDIETTTQDEIKEQELINEIKEEVIKTKEIQEEPKINIYPAINILSKATITKNIDDEEGILVAPSSVLPIIDDYDEYYKINYQDNEYYIKKDMCEEINGYNINLPLIKNGYTNKSCDLILFNEDEREEVIKINSHEFVEIYEEFDDMLLIKVNDLVGYISKCNVDELDDIFVVVDISDQELTMYKDIYPLLKSPVVTGKNGRTHLGMFKIYNISGPRYLVGPGYRSYVDIMMKFDGNIGLHDAEYHTHDNGFKHGWRSEEEFGGNTFLTNGSHGCVNMPHDKVMELSKNIGIGTTVFVKK